MMMMMNSIKSDKQQTKWKNLFKIIKLNFRKFLFVCLYCSGYYTMMMFYSHFMRNDDDKKSRKIF